MDAMSFFGAMLVFAPLAGLAILLIKDNSWALMRFSCNVRCCYPRVFAICPHGGTPTDESCPHDQMCHIAP